MRKISKHFPFTLSLSLSDFVASRLNFIRQVPKTIKRAFTMVELIIVILVVGILALIALPKIKEDHLYELVDQTVALIRYTQQLAMQDNPYDPADPLWFKKRWSIQFTFCPEGLNKFGYIGEPYGPTVYKETNPGGTPRPIFAKDPSNPNGFLYSGYVAIHSPGHPRQCDLNKFNKKLDFRLKGVASIYSGGFYGKGADNISLIDTINGTSRGTITVSPTNCPNATFDSPTISFDEFGRPHIPSQLGRPYGGSISHCGGINAVAFGAGYIVKRFKFTIAGRKEIAHIYIEGETGLVHVKYKENKAGNFSPYEWDANGY